MRNKTKKRLYRVISLLVCMLMAVMNIHIVQVHAAEKSYQYCQTKTEKGVTFFKRLECILSTKVLKSSVSGVYSLYIT